MRTLITNGKIFTGEEIITSGNILVENGRVVGVTKETPPDADLLDIEGMNISAGWIDIQINGGYDRYFSHMPDTFSLQDIYTACRDFATPYFLVTLISSPREVILKAIEATKAFMKEHPGILGMHLEGPFINPEKHGAHSRAVIRKPDDEELLEIIEKGRGVIKMITVAPECLSNRQLEWLLESDMIVSAGHSMMNYDETQEAFSKGVRLITHLYNAMTPMGHRECGMTGAIFDNENVYAPIILDGGHCHYAAARVAYRQKTDKLILITDSSFLGRRKPRFNWEGLDIEMVNGYYRNREGQLAGAAISIPEAVKNAKEHLNISLQDAVEMASSRVAGAISMQDKIGFIKPGYPATFTLFDDNLENVKLLEC